MKKEIIDILRSIGFDNFKFFRKFIGGKWYRHELNGQIPIYGTFWARYGTINRYTKVIETEDYTKAETK